MQTKESELVKSSNLIAKVNEQKAYGEYEVRKGQFLKSSQMKTNKSHGKVCLKSIKQATLKDTQKSNWEHTGEMTRLFNAGTKINLPTTPITGDGDSFIRSNQFLGIQLPRFYMLPH